MSTGFTTLGLDVAVLAVWAVLVFLGLRGVRWLVDLLPMGAQQRETVTRFAPLAGVGAALVFTLLATRKVFEDHPQATPFTLVLVIATFVAASWSAIRDFVSGVVLKAERACAAGDFVRVDGIEGRVVDMGPRALTLETHDGDIAVVPYSNLARGSIVRTRAVATGSAHQFRVPPPPGLSLAEMKHLLLSTALRNHWSSIVREPEVSLTQDGELHVTVYALDAARGPEIEAAVRRAALEPGTRRGTIPPAGLKSP